MILFSICDDRVLHRSRWSCRGAYWRCFGL